jgi:hypothetical protein
MKYHILKDGDNTLKGNLAEEIFRRMKSKLLPKEVLLCETLKLRHFIRYYWHTSKYEIDKIISEYASGMEPILSPLSKE